MGRIWPESLAKRSSQRLVGGLGDKYHRRAAISPCDPECGYKKKASDNKVLPGVERPLAVPGELQRVGERLEVGDGPLVAVSLDRKPSHSHLVCRLLLEKK